MSNEELDAEVVTHGRLSFNKVQGLLLPIYGVTSECITNILNMEVKEEDIFVVTYPKCGTTWSQYMIWEILHNPDNLMDLVEMMFKRFPFLEMSGTEVARDMASPRTFKLHTPFRLTPFRPQGKYLIMARNPFDVCISYFYFMTELDMVIGTPEDYTFDEHFEHFMDGTLPFGDYYDFLNDWFEQRHQPNVLFLFYEDCKADPEAIIKKIAAFLGDKYSKRLEEDPQAIPKILKHTSFDYMKEKVEFLMATKESNSLEKPSEDVTKKKVNMFRQGKVGDWKSYLTEDQKKRLFEKLQNGAHDPELKKKLTPAEFK